MSIGYLKILKFNNIFILSTFPMFIKCVLIKHIYDYFFPTLLVLPTNLPGNHMHIFHFITLFLNCLFEIHQCFLYACDYVAVYWGISNLAVVTSPKESGSLSLSRHQQLIDSLIWEELQKPLLQSCCIFFSLKVQVLGMSLWLLCVDACNSCVRKRNNTSTLSSFSAGSYLPSVFTGVSLSCRWWEVGKVKILICWALRVIYTLSFDQLRISALRNTHCKMSISEWGWEKRKPVGINVPIYNSVGGITI